MSIERSQISDSVQQARKGAEGEVRSRREPPPQASVDQFRQAMHARQEARDEFAGARAKGAGELSQGQRSHARAAARDAATADAVEAGRGLEQRQHGLPDDPAELLALMQAQSALRDGAPAAPAAPMPSNPAAFAELLERHVRQLAVGGGSATGREDGQVLLRLADATLPGTDLMLSRTADGWVLRADVRSRESYDAIREAAPDLARRFAERDLGELRIDPRFHG